MAVCFPVVCDYLGFLSLIFVPEFYFIINGNRNRFSYSKPRKGGVISPHQIATAEALSPIFQLLLARFPAYLGFPLLSSRAQIHGSSQLVLHVSSATLAGKFCSEAQGTRAKLVRLPYTFAGSVLSLSCFGVAPAPPGG